MMDDRDAVMGCMLMAVVAGMVLMAFSYGGSCMQKRREAIVECVKANPKNSPADCAAALKE